MSVGTCKRVYKVIFVMMGVLAAASAVELVRTGAIADDYCSHFTHGCWNNDGYIPCSSVTCGSAMQLINMQTALCDDNNILTCDLGQSVDYFTSAAATTWYYCQTVSNGQLPGCNDACMPCANLYIYWLSCDQDGYCGTRQLLQCGASVGTGC